jgi:hypothetical protein
MERKQFVACADESCPMNADRQCRSPFIVVDEDGFCALRKNNGPFPIKSQKSQTESYVTIRECKCLHCRHWEVDEETEFGACGIRDDLFFNIRNMCDAFEKQIEEPGFASKLG